MSDSPSSDGGSSRPHRSKPRAFRLVLGALVVLALLLVALYFTLTSSAFLKAVVLPRVGTTLQARVSAGDVLLRPFSSIELRQLKVETEGPQPLFEAERVRVVYKLFGLVSGRMEFPEIVVEAPRVSVIQQPGGKTNLDPLIEGRSESTPPAKRGQSPRVDIGTVTVTQGALRFSRLAADGGGQASEINDLAVTIEDIGNEREGRIKLSAALAHTATPGPGLTNGQGRIQASLNGSWTVKLLKDLQPEVVRGDARLEVQQATGVLKELAGLAGVLNCDLASTEVRDLSARFQRASEPLGSIRIRGPVDLARSEARLSLEVAAVDRNVLNLVGAPFGLDFLETKISATTTLDVSRGGDTLGATGRGTVTKFGVRQAGASTPPLDLDLNYHVTVNLAESSAVLHKFLVNGQQSGRELLNVTLDRPMYLAWGELPQGINESDVRLAVKDLRLGDWAAFLGTNAPLGTLNVTSKITCQLDGRKFGAEFGAQLKDVVWEVAGYRVDRGDLQLQAAGTFSDFRSLLVEKYTVRLEEEGTPLGSLTGSAGYDLSSGALNVQVALEAGLPQILAQFPLAQLSATSGRLSVDGLVGQESGQQKATLNLNLGGFTGAYDLYRFENYDARVGVDAEATSQNITLRRFEIASRKGVGAFGGIDLNGRYDRQTQKGEFSLNIGGLSETGLQPVLAPLLAPRQLASVQVTGSGSIRQDPVAGIELKLGTELKGLRILDPDGMIPNVPLDLQVQLDAGYRSNVVELTQLVVGLPTTPRAANQMTLQGRVNLLPADAMTGQMRLSAEALELSGLLDAFLTNSVPVVSAGSTSPAPQDRADEEPAAMNLPIQLFTAELKIDRLFARDAAISNWVATAKLATNILVVDPFRLTVNGAPVAATATIDLGKPGFVYEANLQADKMPLGPMVDAAMPERRGQFNGDLDLKMQVRGAGLTDANLQKNLNATFDGGSTNLNLALGDVRSSLLKSLINTIISIPELVRNPGGVVGNLLGQLTGGGRADGGGWVDEFARSPIQVITARGKAGGGRVELEQARVQSPAFSSDAEGTIVLAPILTNSTLQIPVHVALRRPLAEGVGLVSANAPTNDLYVKLPDFVTMQGTLGNPKTKLNTLALVAVTAKAGAGLIGNTGNANLDKAAGVLDAVGSLFGTGGGTTTNRAAANAPAGQAKTSGVLDAVGSLFGTGGGTSTNRAGTNAPAGQTNRSTIPSNPLDLFKRK